MTGIVKRRTLLLLGLVTILTVMIASGLSQLRLRPGMPLPILNNSQVVIPPVEQEQPVVFQVSGVLQVLLTILLSGLMLYVIYRLVRGAGGGIARDYFQMALVIILVAGSITFLVMLLPMSENPLVMEQKWPCSPFRPDFFLR